MEQPKPTDEELRPTDEELKPLLPHDDVQIDCNNQTPIFSEASDSDNPILGQYQANSQIDQQGSYRLLQFFIEQFPRFLSITPTVVLSRLSIASVAFGSDIFNAARNHQWQPSLKYADLLFSARTSSQTLIIDGKQSDSGYIFDRFFRGVGLITDYVLPSVVYSLLMVDTYTYIFYPEWCYQNTYSDSLFGFSPNGEVLHGSLLSNLGTDIFPWFSTWGTTMIENLLNMLLFL